MKRLGIALLLLCSIGLASASADVVSRVAAVVNKDIITTLQLDQKLRSKLAKLEKQPSPVQLGALRQELLSRMIEETLVQQRITALKLRVTEDEIETAILDVQKKNKLTREELEDAVALQGLGFEEYRDNLKQQILRYKLIGEEVRSQVDVPEREVKSYYDAHADDYRLPPEIKLSAITFPVSEKSSQQEIDKVMEMAIEAMGRLRKGEDFVQVAAGYNETYGATGNELGSFEYKELIPEFVSAVEGVEAGSYSEPVKAVNGIHVLRVDERLAGGLRDFEVVKYDIYQQLLDQKTDLRIKEWTRALKANAFIDIRL